MTIYTSYFDNIANVKNPISIAGRSPVWFNKFFIYKKLAPKYEWWIQWKRLDDPFSKEGMEFYINKYKETVLSILDKDKTVKDLFGFYPDSDEVTLLCWEKPNEFCHRHLVSYWLKYTKYQCYEKGIGFDYGEDGLPLKTVFY